MDNIVYSFFTPFVGEKLERKMNKVFLKKKKKTNGQYEWKDLLSFTS